MLRTLLCRRFGVARDWFMSLIFFGLVDVGGVFWAVFVAAPTMRGETVISGIGPTAASAAPPPRNGAPFESPVWMVVLFCIVMPLLALLSNVSLIMTVFGDAGFMSPALPIPPPAASAVVVVPPVLLESDAAAADAAALASAAVAEEGADDGPDSHFCPVCRVDVLGFDHHCSVVGACIGRHTMGPFVVFLSVTGMYCLIGLVPILVRLASSLSAASGATESLVGLLSSAGLLVHAAIALACVYGGGYCSVLAVHYTLSAYQGLFSYHRRRLAARDLARRHPSWQSRELQRALGGFQRYCEGGRFANFVVLARQTRQWRLAPTSLA